MVVHPSMGLPPAIEEASSPKRVLNGAPWFPNPSLWPFTSPGHSALTCPSPLLNLDVQEMSPLHEEMMSSLLAHWSLLGSGKFCFTRDFVLLLLVDSGLKSQILIAFNQTACITK